MKKIYSCLLLAQLVLGFGVLAPAASAQSADEPDTIILSDALQYDDVNKTSVFEGNVILTRGTMSLRSDKLTTREDAQGNQFGTATAAAGKLVTIHQENPEKFELLTGTGTSAEYDGQSGDITLTGQATVVRQVCGETVDTVQGARIVYRQKTNTYQAVGGNDSAASGGRVRSMAQPQSRIARALAKCKSGQS